MRTWKWCVALWSFVMLTYSGWAAGNILDALLIYYLVHFVYELVK